MHILVMEDDPVLADILVDYLSEFYTINHAYHSDEVYTLLDKNSYDLFIFDINVVGKNGLKLLQELREFSYTTPTIFITAYKDTEHLTQAFEAGAHDYIKKPFELDELQARILNLKRIFNLDQKELIELSSGITFNPKMKTIETDNKTVSLGHKNTLILEYFLKNKTRIISNNELIQNIWDYDSLPSEATLRSHIRDIRNIIGKEKIKTVRSEGYIYE
ncbi:response regulator transcription factor [Sulfurimonas marina]|uniref:Response regulator transcription factor n=1 Tax=Sulfurimonas marina TaxID=2590551 RepID=A0A7M1AXS7_9BACT|nr:response regulator transcription factor [Sulfurimonas marina]QOP42225.1 response regulator transcription factor [Sulfurimonas marina]